MSAGVVNNRLIVYVTLGNGEHALPNFLTKTRIWDKVPEGGNLISGDTLISIKHKHSAAQVEDTCNPVCKKNQLDLRRCCDTIPACDGHARTDRHRPIANTYAGIASHRPRNRSS